MPCNFVQLYVIKNNDWHFSNLTKNSTCTEHLSGCDAMMLLTCAVLFYNIILVQTSSSSTEEGNSALKPCVGKDEGVVIFAKQLRKEKCSMVPLPVVTQKSVIAGLRNWMIEFTNPKDTQELVVQVAHLFWWFEASHEVATWHALLSIVEWGCFS